MVSDSLSIPNLELPLSIFHRSEHDDAALFFVGLSTALVVCRAS